MLHCFQMELIKATRQARFPGREHLAMSLAATYVDVASTCGATNGIAGISVNGNLLVRSTTDTITAVDAISYVQPLPRCKTLVSVLLFKNWSSWENLFQAAALALAKKEQMHLMVMLKLRGRRKRYARAWNLLAKACITWVYF